MKEWGILPEGTGYVDGKLVSDTKEIVFDPDNARFHIHTDYCGYFSGAPEEVITLSDTVTVKAENERITLALIAKEEKPLGEAESFPCWLPSVNAREGKKPFWRESRPF